MKARIEFKGRKAKLVRNLQGEQVDSDGKALSTETRLL
jgi:hypothetical protein